MADSDEGDANQQGMHDRLDQLTDQVRQQARDRRIRNITHTNTITTVYEDPGGGRRPTVRRTSTRTGPGRHSRQSSQSGSGFLDFLKTQAGTVCKNRKQLKHAWNDHRRRRKALYKRAGLQTLF